MSPSIDDYLFIKKLSLKIDKNIDIITGSIGLITYNTSNLLHFLNKKDPKISQHHLNHYHYQNFYFHYHLIYFMV